MKKRGILAQYMRWYQRCTENRKTRLSFNKFQSDPFRVENGLDQGDLLSGTLYLIYNSDLLSISDLNLGKQMLLFVDDMAIIVTGKDFHKTHNKVRRIMSWPDGVFEWAILHNCTFGIDKF